MCHNPKSLRSSPFSIPISAWGVVKRLLIGCPWSLVNPREWLNLVIGGFLSMRESNASLAKFQVLVIVSKEIKKLKKSVS